MSKMRSHGEPTFIGCHNNNKKSPITESQKTFILESAIVRLAAGDSREQVRAALIRDLPDFTMNPPSLYLSESDWKDLLNEAVLEEARRHNEALPEPDFSDYSPGPVNFDASITRITCENGEWFAEAASAEFLDWDRHMLPMPGSKVIHSKDGIITSELLPDTWDGVKQWQERHRKQTLKPR